MLESGLLADLDNLADPLEGHVEFTSNDDVRFLLISFLKFVFQFIERPPLAFPTDSIVGYNDRKRCLS